MSTVVVRTTSQTVVLRSGIDVAGSGLPDVGTNGQVLTVVLGEWVPADPSAGSGAVDSVNTKTGIVFLDAADVGAATPAEVATAVSDHSAVTVGVHGIADTSALETTTGAQAKADAAIVSATAAEFVRDTIGTALTAGTGITVTVNGGADTITLLVDTATEAERIDDRVAALLVAGTNVTLVYDDVANTLTINATGGGGGTPDAHAVSHQDGGSDELALDGSQITSGTVDDARLPAGLARDAEVAAAYQPLDSDLTAIAALTTPATTITGAAQKASNLSDLANAATARTNLGAAADSAVVHLAGTETITGTKTLSDGGNLIIVHDDDGPTFYSVYGVADKTSLPAGVNRPVMKLEAGLDATLDLLSHDYNIGLIVQNSTADGAALSVGNTASGDGIYAQATGTAHALTNTPHAVNISAGPLTLLDTTSGTATATTATTLTDAGAGWTDDEWVGRWVVTPDVSDPATAKRMRVTDNDDDTLTGTGGWVSSQTPPFAGQSPTTTPSGTTPYVIPNSSANGINMHITSTGHAFRALRVAGAGNGGVGDEMILLDDATGAGYYLRGVAGATQKFAVGIDGSWSGRNLIGLIGTSGTANQTSRWKGCTTTGSPTGATFATGDWVTTLDGHIWVCISGGTPGTWVDVGGGGGSGDVATDTIWDAAGDLVVGTGADTAARLAIGTGGTFLRAGSSTLAWAVPAISEVSGLTAALAAKAALVGATFTGAVILDADPATALEAATKQYVDAVAGGSVAADAIWDAAGDIVYGTGADTATRLAVGTGGTFLKVSAGVPVWAVPAISEISGLTAALAAKALQTDLDAHTGDTVDAHDASAISFTPNGSIAATDVQTAIQEVRDEAGGGGAPTDAGYLVTAAHAGLSAELAVGATPNGELGGTWDAITVDATHSGSSHAAVQAAAEGTAATALSDHEAAADPHPGYTTAAELAAATFNASAITAGTMATARLGSGSASSTTFLRGDQTYATPAAATDPLLYVLLRQQYK